jgi:Tol biopolymer transport system component
VTGPTQQDGDGVRFQLVRAATAATVAAVALAAPSASGAAGPLDGSTTERVSVSSAERQTTGLLGNAFADHPSVSADGRIVTFTSNAGGLTPDCGRTADGAFLGYNVYARDLARGTTELVSAEPGNCPTQLGADQPVTSSVSADGRFVAFSSGGAMVRGFTLSRNGDAHSAVYVRDRLRKRTVAVSVGYDGKPNNADAQFPAISGDGRYVTFESGASNLVPHDPLRKGDNLVMDVYVRDLRTGRTERVGSPHPRAHRIEKVNASISHDGRWITYETGDAALFSSTSYGPSYIGPTTYPPGIGPTQVFLYDRATKRSRMVSRSALGDAGNGVSTYGGFREAGNHAISANGRYVVFQSDANNLLDGDPLAAVRRNLFPGDADPADDVYLFDAVTGALTRVTVGPGGLPADRSSGNPAISANGRWITFQSVASTLGAPDLAPFSSVNATAVPPSGFDVYLTDRTTGMHRIVSTSTEGVPSGTDATMPAVSGNGEVVAFVSVSPTLTPGDTNGLFDVFAHHPSA